MAERDDLRKHFLTERIHLSNEEYIAAFQKLKGETDELLNQAEISVIQRQQILLVSNLNALVEQLAEAGVINRARYNHDRYQAISIIAKKLPKRPTSEETST